MEATAAGRSFRGARPRQRRSVENALSGQGTVGAVGYVEGLEPHLFKQGIAMTKPLARGIGHEVRAAREQLSSEWDAGVKPTRRRPQFSREVDWLTALAGKAK